MIRISHLIKSMTDRIKDGEIEYRKSILAQLYEEANQEERPYLEITKDEAEALEYAADHYERNMKFKDGKQKLVIFSTFSPCVEYLTLENGVKKNFIIADDETYVNLLTIYAVALGVEHTFEGRE